MIPPHHLLILRICRKFNTDPTFQLKIHTVASYVWIVNMVVALLVFVFAQGFWQSASVLYLVLVSLYANFATDYGAVSASLAAKHSVVEEKIEEQISA